MSKRNIIGIGIFFILFVIGLILIYIKPWNLTGYYNSGYISGIVVYFVIITSLFLLELKTKLDIFEPAVLISFIYIMIFSVTLIIDIINHDTVQFGFDPMPGAVKGNIIFSISYIFFILGYSIKNKPNNLKIQRKIDNYDKNRIAIVSSAIWLVGFMGTIFYLLSNGMSTSYILSVGQVGEVDLSNSANTPLGFIGMLSFSMITACVYYLNYGKNKFLKFLFFFLSLATLLVRGFRSVLIILVFAPILLKYLKKNRRPKVITLVILFFAVALMIGAVGFMRNGIRSGQDVNWNLFDVDIIYDALFENFRRYNVFYGMVERIPRYHSYTYGQNYFYTVVMIVPRLIWPGKPQPVMKEILSVSTNDIIASAGAAWPNIGEFYMEFGVIGCIILMYLLGRIMCWSKKLYQGEKSNAHSLIVYSILIPSLITIIAYGYTPSTFYMMAFLFLPVLFIKKLCK